MERLRINALWLGINAVWLRTNVVWVRTDAIWLGTNALSKWANALWLRIVTLCSRIDVESYDVWSTNATITTFRTTINAWINGLSITLNDWLIQQFQFWPKTYDIQRPY